MKRRKFLLGSSTLVATGAFVSGSGAFSSAEVERNVEIAIVGDEDAYLGLSEDDIEEDGVLFGADMPRESPETFDIDNQTAEDITVEIELLRENLEFSDNSSVDKSENGETEEVEIHIDSGEKISNIEITNPTLEKQDDVLRFEVTSDSGGLSIEAERDLELKPETQQKTIEINLPFLPCLEVIIEFDGEDFYIVDISKCSNSFGTAAQSASGRDLVDGERTFELDDFEPGQEDENGAESMTAEESRSVSETETAFDGAVELELTYDEASEDPPSLTVSIDK